jgi:hypothetical protein
LLFKKVKEGYLGPFSKVEVDFSFAPLFPGKFQEEFTLEFEDEDTKDVSTY